MDKIHPEILLGESSDDIRVLADFIRDAPKRQHWFRGEVGWNRPVPVFWD